jgi:hypothetical protein
MPWENSALDPQTYLDEAARLRALAVNVKSGETRARLAWIVSKYEALAECARQVATQRPDKPLVGLVRQSRNH